MNVKVIVPVLVAAAAAGFAPASASAGPSRCTTAQLTAHFGSSNGAAGSTYTPIIWTNKSQSTCTLIGYPGVSFVAPGSGKQVGAAATRNPQHAARTVTLKPGSHASALVQVADYLNYPKSSCTPVVVSGLRVYPPGSRAAEYMPFKQLRKACSTNVHQLSVEATVKGTSGH